MKILDFYADWCNPCKALSKVIEEYQKENPDITIKRINVEDDSSAELVSIYGVRALPTLYLIKDDGTEKSKVGTMNLQQLKEFIEN